MVEFNEENQKKTLGKLHEQEEENFARIIAEKNDFQYTDLGIVPIDLEALRLIPKELAQEAKIGAFEQTNKNIKVAVRDPFNEKTQGVIQDLEKRGFNTTIYIVSTKSLEKIWERYDELSYSTKEQRGSFDISSDDIAKLANEPRKISEVVENIEKVMMLKKGERISQIMEVVVAGALSLKASDIHLEPEETYVRLRYRLDGLLTDITRVDLDTYNLILSRTKLLSGLKLNTEGTAQDGRFSIEIGQRKIEIRTSILPGAYNETIVLRILDPESIAVPFESLGMSPSFQKIVEREISRPNGMVLTTGPTGSGKTTTLYASLQKIHTPNKKIITIENPIEYHLEGIVQTQINTDNQYGFAEGLKSTLRQDPDVIMVGEIRDGETARTAIDAALTGHLVFSTLHTNDAAGTFPRLLDLGADSKTLADAINISMAQRLVRKLKKDQAQEVPLEGGDKELIDKILETIPEEHKKDIQTSSVWKPKDEVSGYKGRVGLFEAILVDDAVSEAISSYSATDSAIWKASQNQGILTMQQDAILKVLRGETTLEEVRRVIDLTELYGV